MNIQQLYQELIRKKIRKDAYSLSGGLPSETYCIGLTEGGWEVYYSERGNKNGLRVFNNEGDACKYFLDFITSVKSVFESE